MNILLYIEELFYLFEKLSFHYKQYHMEWSRILKSEVITDSRDSIMFLVCVVNEYLIGKANIHNHVYLFLGDSLIWKTLRHKFKADDNLDIYIKRIINLKHLLGTYPIPGQLIKLFMLIIKSYISPKPINNISQEAINKGTIFEKYIWNIFNNYPGSGHLFWHYNSGILPERVVLYLDRSDDPPIKKIIEDIGDKGFSWIQMYNPYLYLESSFFVIIRLIYELKKIFPFSLKKTDVWFWSSILRFSIELECNRQIIRKFNIMAMHQHLEWLPSTILKTLSLRMEKGLMLWNHWSLDRYPVAYHTCVVADIIFSWGNLNEGYLNAHNQNYKVIIQTGFISGDSIDGMEKK